MESKPLNIPDTNDADYNQNFTLNELEEALDGLKGSSPGEDGVHYAMITHLPLDCKLLLLRSYNKLWLQSVYPQSWTRSIVVPIFKGKGERANPKNYRPIYLNSCVGKVFERMINNRLSHFLETRELLYQHQYAFRKGKSTVDHLAQFEGILQEALSKNKYAQAVFLDIAKAYDTTWRRLILDRLSSWNIGGRMLQFLDQALQNRTFRVATNGVLSNESRMETGLCQGSVLSVTLFLIAIDTIVQYIPQKVNCLIYADDVILVAEGVNHEQVEADLQIALDSICRWENETGFKISAEKCATIIFKNAHARRIQRNVLQLNGITIPRSNVHKCLGVTFDHNLKFRRHIEDVRAACQKRLQFLRCVAHTSWGGDKQTIKSLYKATILEKMLYAAPILSSVSDADLRRLDTLHNSGLRAITGAFHTSPITSLQVETGIPGLRVLLEQRTAMFAAKRKALEGNAEDSQPFNSEEESETYSSDSSGELWGVPQQTTANTAMRRGKETLDNLEIQLPQLQKFSFPVSAPWKRTSVPVDKSLLRASKQSSKAVLLQMFRKLKATRYRIHRAIYTDGSKRESKSGYSVICEDFVLRRRIHNMSSIYAAESEAVKQAILWVANQNGAGAYVIFTDSLSVITGLEKRKITSRWRDEIVNLYNRCIVEHKEVLLCWVPSHIGIPGNERADREAKAALDGSIDSNAVLTYTEAQTCIKNRIIWRWQQQWTDTVNNKLREVKNVVTPFTVAAKTRRENVVLTRLRIGHTCLTHKHLLEKEDAPKCQFCNDHLTVKHIIVECPALENDRQETGLSPNMREALGDDADSIAVVLDFLRKINLFKSI